MEFGVDEEALAEGFSAEERRARGVFFTPASLVERVFEAVADQLPEAGPDVVVDAACGAGAFLVAADKRFPQASLIGAELSDESVKVALRRVPRASVVQGDALQPTVLPLPAKPRFELWVGNPPYNGTSELLKDPARWKALLPSDVKLPRGTSLREDYLFFLFKAAKRLSEVPGAIAFITSATLLDTFQYAPVRAALLNRLRLVRVIDLGSEAFRGTRVRTCITVWTSGKTVAPVAFEGSTAFTPQAPAFILKPTNADAAALDDEWSARGVTIDELVPISLPGLKTRFDELLTDDEAPRLVERLRAFTSIAPNALGAFATEHGLPASTEPKLRALHEHVRGVEIDERNVKRLWRVRGAKEPRPSWCYLDRRFIPRGDHRLQGAWNPHEHPTKLVFNVRELPLVARLVEEAGCVTAWRHTRFAPLLVPEQVLLHGSAVARAGDALGPLVPNLSLIGNEWATRMGGPRAVFEHLARFVNSEAAQRVWAPAFGTTRAMPIMPPSDDVAT